MADSRWLLAALTALTVVACAGRGPGMDRAQYEDGWWTREVGEGDRKLRVAYRSGGLTGDWIANRDFMADFSFSRPDLGATLYGDTSCGKRYVDAPLSVLINHQLMGFEDVETVSRTDRTLADRGALEYVATGRLDGVPIQLGLTVVRKGPCVFDLVLISPPAGFPEAMADYRVFVDGFEARVSRAGGARKTGGRR